MLKYSFFIVVPAISTTTMTPTLLSRLWHTPKSIPSSPLSSSSTPSSFPSSSGSNPKSIPSSPPSSVSTIPSVNPNQPSHTVLITMGRCNFPFANGASCPCTAGSCTSELYLKGKEELCKICGHIMSLHCDYSKNSALQSNVFYLYIFIVPPSSPPQTLVAASRSQDISPRTKTVESLAQLLEACRVIHVRGTPSSGKTTLALLLLRYYKDRDEPAVLIEGWHNISDPTTHLIEQSIRSGYNGVTPWNLLDLDIVFLIDEAQQSYQDSKLWLGIIKTQSFRRSGPKICLFSSYGSPTTGATKYPHGSTPIHFGAGQRVSISVSSIPTSPSICLFYNEEEFSEVVHLRCTNPTHKLAMDPAAIDYLYSITNGHPGAVTSLLEYLYSVCKSQDYTLTKFKS